MKILIRQIREKKNINRRQLSKSTSISERSLINYENGDSSPTLIQLKKISLALECSINDLYSDY